MKEDFENKNESEPKENLLDNEEDKKEDLIDIKAAYSSYNISNNKLLEEIITVKNKDEKKSIYLGKQTEEEKIGLLSEKEGLKRILRVIQDDLSLEEDTLEETYEHFLNNEDMTKRVIKYGTSRCSLVFMFYVVSPLFGIINLVGIFESLLMMKILLQVLQNAFIAFYNSWFKKAENIDRYSIYDFNMKYNYYYMFFEDAKKDSFDFNLMLLTAFIGDILLQSRGFRVSTFIFALINAGAIFLITSFSFFNYDLDYNTYSFFRMLYLLLGYLLLLIGAGSSALLSQQIIIDSNYKYNDYVKKLNEKSLEVIEERRKQNMAKREKLENEKLPTLNDMLIFKEEDEKGNNLLKKNNEEENFLINNMLDNKEEENNFPLKSAKSEEITFSKTEKIVIDEFKEESKNKKIDDELRKSLEDMKRDISKVNRQKVMLGRSKTMLVTKRDEMKDQFANRMKEKERRMKLREEAKANMKKKNKFDSFFMVCVTTIIGYFIKYLINIIIAENSIKIDNYMYLTNCGNDTDCFHNIIRDNNLSRSQINLFNEIIENIYNDGEKSFIIVIIIYGGCIVSSILLYSFFVCIFEKRKKKDDQNAKNSYRVCEICGYIIYSQNIIINPKPPFCQCCKLLCETFQNCLNMALCSIYECHCCDEEESEDDNTENNKDDNTAKSDNEESNKEKNDAIEESKHNIKKEKAKKKSENDEEYEYNRCFNCCCEYKESDYRKNKQFFCYCYQAQRKSYWLNKFLTNEVQKKLVPFMIEYFFLQILICAFEQQYFIQFENDDYSNSNPNNTNIINDTNIIYINFFDNKTHNNTNNNTNNSGAINFSIDNLYSFLTFILSFFLFFYLTLTFHRIINFTYEPEKEEGKNGGLQNIRNLSLGILGGTHSILLFDGLFSLIFSSLYLSDSDNDLFKNNNILLVPILINKFYYFTLIFYCISYSEEKRKFELISSSTLISVYLFIINTIISLIRSNTPLKALYIIQLVLACCVPCLCILLILIYLFLFFIDPKITCYIKMTNLCLISSFICCFAGFWMTGDIFNGFIFSTSEENCDCSSDCFCDCCYCWFDCFDYICYNCCCEKCSCIICRCFNCFFCYDCLGCCKCCYCCREECACNLC